MSDKEIFLELEDHFDRFGWTWNLKGKGKVQPDRYDFQAALDEAARILYAEGDNGDNMLQVGRLIIIKQRDGLDVYVLAGTISAEDAQLSLKEKNDQI
jgi:hypothetical protein